MSLCGSVSLPVRAVRTQAVTRGRCTPTTENPGYNWECIGPPVHPTDGFGVVSRGRPCRPFRRTQPATRGQERRSPADPTHQQQPVIFSSRTHQVAVPCCHARAFPNSTSRFAPPQVNGSAPMQDRYRSAIIRVQRPFPFRNGWSRQEPASHPHPNVLAGALASNRAPAGLPTRNAWNGTGAPAATSPRMALPAATILPPWRAVT